MDEPDNPLICPITWQIFTDPVIAEDGHTYERKFIIEWIKDNGTSPLTRQKLSVDRLIPNIAVRKAVQFFEESVKNKQYRYVLGKDVEKQRGRPIFQGFGKTIYRANWLSSKEKMPDIVLLKIEGARAEKQASFYAEISRHPNIVRTYGLVEDSNATENSLILLQEFAPLGSLYDVLQDDRESLQSEQVLIRIFLQVTDAMIFLACNHIVHGDLACRNVLVFRFDRSDPRSILVKVTDFGLSRYSKLYSARKHTSASTSLTTLPTRYAAPELFKRDVKKEDHSEKSDVYSMGVLMWEAYSGGALPWSKVEHDEEIMRRIITGETLRRPSLCSDNYWLILLKTWSMQPQDRPTFEELKLLLSEQFYGRKVKRFLETPLADIPQNARWVHDKKHSRENCGGSHGLAIHPDNGMIFIADFYAHRINAYNPANGTVRVVVGEKNAIGSGSRTLQHPTDVLVDTSTNSIIICDRGNRRIVRWSLEDGNEHGQELVNGIDGYGLAMDNTGALYVSDWLSHEVKRFPKGQTKGKTVAGGNSGGNKLNQLLQPKFIAVDDQYNLYISDDRNHRVMKWGKDSTEGVILISYANAEDRFCFPRGIVVDKKCTVYVVLSGYGYAVRKHCGDMTNLTGDIIINEDVKDQFKLNGQPIGMCMSRSGDLYISTRGENGVRKFALKMQ